MYDLFLLHIVAQFSNLLEVFFVLFKLKISDCLPNEEAGSLRYHKGVDPKVCAEV
jgi:hypothetical protein